MMSGVSPFPSPVDPTGYCMYDVIDLMDKLMMWIPFDSDVRDVSQAVKTAAEAVILHFAVNDYHGHVEGANGLSIYFPSGIEFDTQYDERYDEVDFAIDIYWDDFLHYYHSVENAPETPPSVFITSPTDDDVIDRHENKEMKIQGTAFDAQDTISSIEIKIDDGEWMVVGASGQWYYDLSLTELENGNHTISARSYDGNEYSAEDNVEIFILGGESPKEEAPPLNVSIVILIWAVIGIISALFILKKRRKN
jgi:hypothetical protein